MLFDMVQGDLRRARETLSGFPELPSAETLRFVGIEPVSSRLEEHCRECDAPHCYAVCALYDPHVSAGCRRFEFGLLAEPDTSCWTGGHVDVSFRWWSRLKVKALTTYRSALWPYGFLMQIDIQADPEVEFLADLEFSTSPWRPGAASLRVPLVLSLGRRELYIPPTDLSFLSGATAVEASVSFPAQAPPRVRIYAANFVKSIASRDGSSIRPCKLACVDLDHTVWGGEVGEGPVPHLLPGIRQTLESLRARRVHIVAVSKALAESAKNHLTYLGIIDIFSELYLSVSVKSESVLEIMARFAVLPQEVVFIDDDPYEREEVSRVCPGVRILDAPIMSSLGTDPLITGAAIASAAPASELSQKQCFTVEDFRSGVAPCLQYRAPSITEIPRCWELLQRTNRLHCVEWRPTFADFVALLESPGVIVRVGICADRTGLYGLACFGLGNIQEDTAVVCALTYSCRIAGREFAFAFAEAFGREIRLSTGSICLAAPPAEHASHEVEEIIAVLHRGVNGRGLTVSLEIDAAIAEKNC